jgi:hypothetical protein
VPLLVVVLLGAMLASWSACGDDGGARVCEPGASQACACTSGGSGAQTCAADGSGWQPCECTSADADADADADTDAGADGNADADGDAGAGTWFDTTSGLLWESPRDTTNRNWDDAVAYCDGLALGGHDDWRLPTISELRSLIRGCPATVTGGPCGVTDTCLGNPCWMSCGDCTMWGGPGDGGAYWPPGLRGAAGWCWSSSSKADSTSLMWYVDFSSGNVSISAKASTNDVLCVHPGP